MLFISFGFSYTLIHLIIPGGADKLCLIPTKTLSPWTPLDRSQIVCPLDHPKISRNTSMYAEVTVDLDTTDVFSARKILGTSSKFIQLQTCCTSHPLWFSDEISKDSKIIESNTVSEVSEGIPAHPDPVCNKELLSSNTKCVHKVFRVDKQEIIYYSSTKGFPPNWECAVSESNEVSCRDLKKHTSFQGTFPHFGSKSAECPVKWIPTNVIMYFEGGNHYVDFTEVNVQTSKVVCSIVFCNRTWMGLSNKLLIVKPKTGNANLDSYPTCSNNFNYKLNVEEIDHNLIKSGLDDLKSNEKCEIAKASYGSKDLIFSLISEWDIYYPRHPGIHNGYKIQDKNILYATQLYELVREGSFKSLIKNETCQECREVHWSNGDLQLRNSTSNLLYKAASICKDYDRVMVSIYVKGAVDRLFIDGETGETNGPKVVDPYNFFSNLSLMDVLKWSLYAVLSLLILLMFVKLITNVLRIFRGRFNGTSNSSLDSEQPVALNTWEPRRPDYIVNHT